MASMFDRRLWTTEREKPNTYPVRVGEQKHWCLQIDESAGIVTVVPGGYPGTAKKRYQVIELLRVPRERATIVTDGTPKPVRNLSMYEEADPEDPDKLPCIVLTWE